MHSVGNWSQTNSSLIALSVGVNNSECQQQKKTLRDPSCRSGSHNYSLINFGVVRRRRAALVVISSSARKLHWLCTLVRLSQYQVIGCVIQFARAECLITSLCRAISCALYVSGWILDASFLLLSLSFSLPQPKKSEHSQFGFMTESLSDT